MKFVKIMKKLSFITLRTVEVRTQDPPSNPNPLIKIEISMIPGFGKITNLVIGPPVFRMWSEALVKGTKPN